MSHHTHTTEIRNPGPFRISPTAKLLFGICVIIGAVTFVIAAMKAPERAWPNFVLNYFYFLMLALFGGFFTSVQHVTNAHWSVTVRRLMESLMAYLPIAAVLAIVLFLGRHHLYEWTHAEVVAKDHILHAKNGYLNEPFWVARMVVFFALWIGLGRAMVKNSLKQDQTGDGKLTLSNIKLATAFLPVFALGMTLFSYDLVMSLEPHWFSTMYGVYAFAGLFYSGLALLAILTIQGRRKGVFSNELVNENHLHDIGKFMFAFTVFWGYIMFSQLMLMWYANLPEETPYYIRRFQGGWWTFSIALFTAHFLIPFFGLLPRGAKRHEGYLYKMAWFMLFAQWLDVYYLVMPPMFPQGPVFGWVEVGMFLGFMGLFGFSVARALEKNPALPLKDPRMAECLGHTQ